VISCSEKLEKIIESDKNTQKELRQRLEILCPQGRKSYVIEYSGRGIEFGDDNFEFEETECQ
jgi:hypothetical protein